MRIALHAEGEAGRRAGRILSAERDLVGLGMYGHHRATEERRTTAIRSLSGYNPLVTDAPDTRSFALVAAEEGVSCVVAGVPRLDRRLKKAYLDREVTLLVGCDLGGGIADTLASHEMAATDRDSAIRVAWTTEGRPQRRGEAVPFPEPVGPRWASRLGRAPRRRKRTQETTVERFVAPIGGEWAGAVVRVSGEQDGRQVEQVVGVADQKDHLAAIALAAGAIAVAQGAYPPGIHRPAVAAEAYLDVALRIGLFVATHTVRE